jgi:hypothetical protein
MPILQTTRSTLGGHPVVRSVYEHPVTVADAKAFVEKVKPGSALQHHGHLILGKLTGLDADARKALSEQKPDPQNPVPVALVMPSAMLRMTAGLVARATGTELHFFSTEAEALTWLDEAMAAYEAKRNR